MKSFLLSLLILSGGIVSQNVIGQVLSNIESVEYDPISDRFLVSNGNRIIEVDDTGAPVAFFGTDAKANYGMEVMGTNLFTIVGSSVKAYDLTSAIETSSITITGAQFLNGMASDANGNRIWVSDFGAKKIYEIDFSNLAFPSYSMIASNTVTTPNGICFDEPNNRIVFVNWGSGAKIKMIDLTNYLTTTLVENSGVGNIDGIDNDSEGNFYISSWSPNRITKYNNNFSSSEIILSTGLSSPADISYAQNSNKLGIPNTGNQTVLILNFSPTITVDENSAADLKFRCYPNPVTDKSVVEFTLQQSATVKLTVIDQLGQLVLELFEENLGAGPHKFFPGALNIPRGQYIWHLSDGVNEISTPFIH